MGKPISKLASLEVVISFDCILCVCYYYMMLQLLQKPVITYAFAIMYFTVRATQLNWHVGSFLLLCTHLNPCSNDCYCADASYLFIYFSTDIDNTSNTNQTTKCQPRIERLQKEH